MNMNIFMFVMLPVLAIGDITNDQINTLTTSTDIGVRISIIQVFSKERNADAVPILTQLLSDPLYPIRSESAHALGRIGTREAADALCQCALSGADDATRIKCIQSLARTKSSIHTPQLLPLLEDTNPTIRRTSSRTLKKLGYRPNDTSALMTYFLAAEDWDAIVSMGPEAFDILTTYLTTGNPLEKLNAAEALGKLGDNRAATMLRDAFKHADKSQLRACCAEALAQLHDTTSIPLLEQQLADWNIGKRIAKALNQLGWKPQTRNDQIYIWITQRNKQQLLSNWTETKALLINDIYNHGNQSRMENAALTIITLGRQELIPELIDILESGRATSTIAIACLNSGNLELENTVRDIMNTFNRWDIHSYANPENKKLWGSM